jgi:hypothetical protein
VEGVYPGLKNTGEFQFIRLSKSQRYEIIIENKTVPGGVVFGTISPNQVENGLPAFFPA